MCSKFVLKALLRKRLFCVFDRNLPYEVVATYRKQTPSTELDVAPVFTAHGGFAVYEKPVFTKIIKHRVEDNVEAKIKLDRLLQGQWCIKCGDPKFCTKRVVGTLPTL